MRKIPVGRQSDISVLRKSKQGITPCIRVADMGKGSLPGSTRWRNRYRSASPVVTVDPFDARGCRVCTSYLRNACIDNGVIPARLRDETPHFGEKTRFRRPARRNKAVPWVGGEYRLRSLDSGPIHPRRRIRGESGVTSVFEIRSCSATSLRMAVLLRSGSGEENLIVQELHSQ